MVEEEEKADHISSLPKEILHHIMSMLSFKEAVRSSFLSTSWRSLMSPSRVNIERDESKDEVITINEIIESLSKSGHSFQTLKLHLGSYNSAAAAVCTKGVHGELHLDFSGHTQFLLPHDSSFSLILDQISSLCRPPSFSYIKILHLRSVSRLVGDMVSDLCSSCSNLESLKLEKCDGLESVDVKYSSLKNLEMADCANIVGIMVSAENLHSFSYKGVFPLVQLLHVPNLVDVALDFGDGLGRNMFDCEDSLSLLSSIKDIETLTVSSWFIEVYTYIYIYKYICIITYHLHVFLFLILYAGFLLWWSNIQQVGFPVQQAEGIKVDLL